MRLVLDFQEIDQTDIAVAGGKGASLAALSRIEGLRVPPGFCVTVEAFARATADAPALGDLIAKLSGLSTDEHDRIRAVSAEIREAIEEIEIPGDLAREVSAALAGLGEWTAYAVRSSATAEDLPATSFAGQYDTYLGIAGLAAILHHVRLCWASLFTERAVTYRLRNGVDHRNVRMAVVVQRMIDPTASGVLFTADPVSGHRKILSIEATFGLGEALVSGRVNADVYKVQGDDMIARMEQQRHPVLTDAQIARLAALGRRIEQHFGRPQDIEWCLASETFHILQSRPITTLFPIPVATDGENHVYVSVGHQQMMTDAMKPLGISMWQLSAAGPMHEAGGRVFVDVTRALGTAAGRAGLFAMLGKSDPLVGDALQTIIDRGDFVRSLSDAVPSPGAAKQASTPLEADGAVVAELIAQRQASNAALAREIRTKSGAALFDFILSDTQELKRLLFDPRSHQVLMAAIDATWWLNDRLEAWLGEKNAADVLAQSVAGNVTSEMGLELLNVADVVRAHPAALAVLQRADHPRFLDALSTVEDGAEVRDAIQRWLDKYGMRGIGEIDLTRPRWSERPESLVPLILRNVRNFEPGEATRRFEQGRRAAMRKEVELLERVRSLPDGDQKAAEVKRMIDRLRTFIAYREYPKYFMVNRHAAYRQALLREADRLVEAKVIADREDIYFLTFEELRNAVHSNQADRRLIRDRRAAFRVNQRLTPPRVLTSDGEMVSGSYRRGDRPADALIGLAVSAGSVEGRARVVFDPATAELEPGDILVTSHTDPSWTPIFVAIKGLVTEVGGLMTHGAVIAREYGLPAVVGVEHATRLITDGQLIRVDGTNGYIEILSSRPAA
jgi:pyruvate,water dikinase